MLHYSTGTIKAGPQFNKLIVEIDPSFRNYYKFIPTYKNAQTQMHRPHITIVRVGKEYPLGNIWKYDKIQIPFVYSPYINYDGTYYFLNAWSKYIVYIRRELGLKDFRFNNSYHISIGNVK